MTLQKLLDSVAADLDPAIDYRALLCSGGYRTPNAMKQAGNADQLQQACRLLPGDADIIWNVAGGVAGWQLYSHVRQQSIHVVVGSLVVHSSTALAMILVMADGCCKFVLFLSSAIFSNMLLASHGHCRYLEHMLQGMVYLSMICLHAVLLV